MSSVVLYFRVHQPYRLRRYSVFDESGVYFDEAATEKVLLETAGRCYRPRAQWLLERLRCSGGDTRAVLLISGTALEQLLRWAPDVVGLLRALVETGCCEIQAQTSHHSLSYVYAREEFARQVRIHRELVSEVLGVEPAMSATQEPDVLSRVGNAMQRHAQEELYKLEPMVRERAGSDDDEGLAALWRKLTTSDNAYSMSTKSCADSQVHGYLYSYDSPYDAYISFMNVLGHLRERLAGRVVLVGEKEATPSGL